MEKASKALELSRHSSSYTKRMYNRIIQLAYTYFLYIKIEMGKTKNKENEVCETWQ